MSHRAFTFDTVFDDAGLVVSAPRPKRAITPEELDAARAAAHAEGERSDLARSQAAAAAALGEIARLLRAALPSLATVAHDHRVASADLALAAGRAIAGAALDQCPAAPAEAALIALAREIESSPRLLVTAPAAQVEALRPALEQVAAEVGFAGAVVVKADAKLPACAFAFDWGDGRASFDPQGASARVGEALATALAAEGLHAEPLALDLLELTA